MKKILILSILLLCISSMKNIFQMCGICVKQDQDDDNRPKRYKKKDTQKSDIMRSMDHYDVPNSIDVYQKQIEEENALMKKIQLQQQQQLEELERQKKEKLRLEELEQKRIQEEKQRQEMIRQQRLENDLKVKKELQIPESCIFENYEPVEGELIDESNSTIQKKIYQDYQYKLQTVIQLDITQPKAYSDLFYAINTIQEAKELNMVNVQIIEKCNFYSIYNEDQPIYYLATVMPSTTGDLVFLNDEQISGYKFKQQIKNKKALKYQAYKELFQDLEKLHENNQVIQSIEPKNLEYGFQQQLDQDDTSVHNIKLYFQNIAYFEEETTDNIFHPKKNFFTHPAYMTYKRNEINRAQDIYALCLSALVVDSYKNNEDKKITTNSFFDAIDYFNDYDNQTDFPKNYSNTKKIKQLKQYGLEQSQKLLEEIKKFYSLEEDILDRLDADSEEESQDTQIKKVNTFSNIDLNQSILSASKITDNESKEVSLEEELKLEKKYFKICEKNFQCYMFLGLNFDVEKIPSAKSYVQIFDYLLKDLEEDEEESSEENIQIDINEKSQNNKGNSEENIIGKDNSTLNLSQRSSSKNKILI